MGIQYSARLVYGFRVEDLETDRMEEDGVDIEYLGLDVYGNGYDTGHEIVGETLMKVKQYGVSTLPDYELVGMITKVSCKESDGIKRLHCYTSHIPKIHLVVDAF